MDREMAASLTWAVWDARRDDMVTWLMSDYRSKTGK